MGVHDANYVSNLQRGAGRRGSNIRHSRDAEACDGIKRGAKTLTELLILADRYAYQTHPTNNLSCHCRLLVHVEELLGDFKRAELIESKDSELIESKDLNPGRRGFVSQGLSCWVVPDKERDVYWWLHKLKLRLSSEVGGLGPI